mgnify:CR=1 FL=1
MHPTRLFKQPEELLDAFTSYKESLIVEARKWPKVQYVGKDGRREVDYPVIPYTFEGFKRYCREHYGEIEQYFLNTGKYYNEFIGVCSRIKEEIREQQIIGGLLGAYNPSITQRLNNLVEKTDNNNTGDLTITVKYEQRDNDTTE